MLKITNVQANSGDCFFIEETENKISLLVDCGFKLTYQHKIKKLTSFVDYIILTHSDEDHINGSIPLIRDTPEKFVVRKVYVNVPSSHEVKDESGDISIHQAKTLEHLLKQKNIPYQNLISGENLSITNNIDLEIISPSKDSLNYFIDKYKEVEKPSESDPISKSETTLTLELLAQNSDSYKSQKSDFANAASIAFILKYKDKKILFLGDSHPEIVTDYLEKLGYSESNKYYFDYIKLSHHGSVKRISNKFISIIGCANYIISTNGGKARSIHPNRETLAKLAIKVDRIDNKEINFFFNYPIEEIVARNGLLITDEEKKNYKINLIEKKHFRYNMNETELLRKVSIQIYKKDNYRGSGALIETNGKFYVITATHVISDSESEPLDLNDFFGKSEEYEQIRFGSLIGEFEKSLKFDISVIEIVNENKFHDFPKISFCNDISFPENQFMFRGTQKSIALKPHTIIPCSLDSDINGEESFCLKVPLQAYTDMKGSVGAEVLSGYSGSGVFIRHAKKNYFTGTAQDIDKDDFTGVNCRSINVVKNHFLESIEIEDFEGGIKQLKINIAEIKKNITEEMIEERKKKNDYGDVENITGKMDAFIQDWSAEDLDGFINDILVWEEIEHNRIRNHSTYRDLIDNAKAIWASGNKKYQVSSVSQGNERFHKILDDLRDILKDELENTSLRSSSSVIAAGEVARLLANCNLDFKK